MTERAKLQLDISCYDSRARALWCEGGRRRAGIAIESAIRAGWKRNNAGLQAKNPQINPQANTNGRSDEAVAQKYVAQNYALSVVLATDSVLQALNRRWRGVNRPTNVLSFPPAGGNFTDFSAGHFCGDIFPGDIFLGDIFLAKETIWREAERASISSFAHLAHLAVHGLLHLCGHNHHRFHERRAMEKTESVILQSLGYRDPNRYI